MAADVLMGNDQDAARWIRGTSRVATRPAAEPAAARGRPAPGRPPAARLDAPGLAVAACVTRRDDSAGRSARHLHALRAARPVRRGTTVLDAARALGVDSIPSAAVAAFAAAARSCRARAGSRSTASSRAAPTSRRAAPTRPSTTGSGASRRTAGSAAAPQVHGDVLVDVPPESQVHRQVVRKGVPVRDFVIDPVVRLHEVEVEPARASPRRPAISAACSTRSSGSGGSPDLEADLEVDPRAPAGARGGRVPSHGGRPRRPRRSRRSGRASTNVRSASRSTSARRRSPGTSRTSPTARCSPPTGS